MTPMKCVPRIEKETFTGRILDIQGTSEVSIFKVTRDWERMYQMYCKEEKENPHGTV